MTLIGTLKRAESRRLKGWPLAIALIAIISLRAIFYWIIGGSADWTPKLNLEFVVLAFRNDTLQSMAAFSALSFLRAFIVLYFWLAALTIINGSAMATDPVQKLVRLHLGRVARWPWPAQLLLPYLVAVVLWTGVEPLLVHLGIMGPVHSATHLFEQAALVGLGLLLSLKYLLPVFLCLHLIASYIYLGTSPVWDFIATTSDNVTAPLRPLPLRFARLDFTPLAGTILILALLHWLPNAILTRFAASQWGSWPQ